MRLYRAGELAWLCSFRGIGTQTALGLLAEIGDFRRFSHPRELMGYLGLVASEYSSGDQQHRGHITKTGNRHARRLLVEAAWHYQHPARALQATRRQPRARPACGLRPRLASPGAPAPPPPHLGSHGKRPTVANVAVARELCGFIWAAMTKQPLREEASAA